jgi:hypothetical protein
MVDKGASFAKYSKNLCWVVSFIGLLLSIIIFTGSGESSMVNGLLWLALAFAFAISAMFLSKASAEVASSGESAGE